MVKIYVAEEVLNWSATTSGGEIDPTSDWARPYDYLDLAFKVIDTHSDEFDLIDSISNLKRAIDHRVKKISSDYCFKKLNTFGYSKGDLDKLTELGLARPALINEIRSIRNHIEHKFAKAPNIKRCAELADFTWYFLKSTDEVCRCIPDHVTFSYEYVFGRVSEYWVELVKPLNKPLWEKFEFVGAVTREMLSSTSNIGFEVDAHYIALFENRSERLEADLDEFNNISPATKLSISGEYFFGSNCSKPIIDGLFYADRMG